MKKFQRVGIVGLGLIGGSLARAVKRRRLAVEVIGFSRRIKTLKKAKKRGYIDRYQTDFQKGIAHLDFLILATPVAVLDKYFREIRAVNPELLVTDVASVKEAVVRQGERILGKNNRYVGSHPIAGSEKSGLDWSRADLFEGRVVILTPTDATDRNALKKVACFWKALGSRVVYLSPREHDRMLALTSHLPHLIAFVLSGLLKKESGNRRLACCIGQGFLDTTRIAKSPPDLWADIFLSNRRYLKAWSGAFSRALLNLERTISARAASSVGKQLIQARKLREELD